MPTRTRNPLLQVTIDKIKRKVFEYIFHRNFTLKGFYDGMLKRSQSQINKQDFVEALKNRVITIDESELSLLFDALDTDRS